MPKTAASLKAVEHLLSREQAVAEVAEAEEGVEEVEVEVEVVEMKQQLSDHRM